MRKSLTLIEILISISLIAIVGLGIYRTLNSGVVLWRSFGRFQAKQNVYIFFEKLVFDLRNRCRISVQQANGDKSKLSFFVSDPSYTLNRELIDEGESTIPSIGPIYQVEYEFLAKEKKVIRRIYRILEKSPVSEMIVLRSVDDFYFSFFKFDEKKDEYIDILEFLTEFPQSISCNVVIKEDNGKFIKMSRIENLYP